MLLLRKVGKILLGDATPPQLMIAALLGAIAGFLPGFFQAPGLILLLFVLVLLLNVNFAVVGICTLVAKTLSIFLLPVSFSIGRVLLEGPLQGAFGFFINAPVSAFFGFEYYAVTGGLVLGILLGLLLGCGIVTGVGRFRRKMAHWQANSERFNQYIAKGWVKLLLFIFAGGLKKKQFEELLAPRKGKYLRPLGIVAVLLLGVVLFIGSLFASDAIVAYTVQQGLQKANGATVDIERAELSLRRGHLTLTGLAVADATAVDTDIFRAAAVEADVNNADLLRKRFHIEKMRFEDASTGEKRRFPGQVIGRIPERERKPKEGDEKTLDDYLREAEVWRDRLAQVRRWLDKMSGTEEEQVEDELPETRSRRIGREIQEKGYAAVKAEHLIEGSPAVLISHLSAEKVRVAKMPDETIDVIGENLSSHPRLVDRPATIRIVSSADTLFAHLDARQASRDGGDGRLEFHYRNLPVDRFAGNLLVDGEPPLRGGFIDVQTSGTWRTDLLSLPLEVTLRDARLAVSGVGETDVERLVFPIGVSGSLDDPRIDFDSSHLADALAAAGKAEFARRLKGETDRLREKAAEKISGSAGDSSGGILDAGRDLLNRNRR